MMRSLRPTMFVGPLVLLVLSATGTQANMPALSPKPTSPAACQKWASSQGEEALFMWGMQENGEPSNKVAIARLTDSCMDEPKPEIVGFGSSVGFDDAFCAKHPGAKVCRGR